MSPAKGNQKELTEKPILLVLSLLTSDTTSGNVYHELILRTMLNRVGVNVELVNIRGHKNLPKLDAEKVKFVCILAEKEKSNYSSLLSKIKTTYGIDKVWLAKNLQEAQASHYLDEGFDIVIRDEVPVTIAELYNSLSLPFNPFIDWVKGISYTNALKEKVHNSLRDSETINVMPNLKTLREYASWSDGKNLCLEMHPGIYGFKGYFDKDYGESHYEQVLNFIQDERLFVDSNDESKIQEMIQHFQTKVEFECLYFKGASIDFLSGRGLKRIWFPVKNVNNIDIEELEIISQVDVGIIISPGEFLKRLKYFSDLANRKPFYIRFNIDKLKYFNLEMKWNEKIMKEGSGFSAFERFVSKINNLLG